MKIDGNKIAEKVLYDLKLRVEKLKENNIFPKLAIILIGNDSTSLSYVSQKEKLSAEIGSLTQVYRFEPAVTQDEIKELVEKLNSDLNVKGIIIQRPLPPQISEDFATNVVSKEKDIDGFRRDSPFKMPLGQAIVQVLKEIHPQNFPEWLKAKKIVVIGKGKTGGNPIIRTLEEMSLQLTVIDSKTPDPKRLIGEGDILISAIGKLGITNAEDLKKGVILLEVGAHKNGEGKLEADYNENEVRDIASFYTSVPGGIGPVNVAMLLKNLVS